MASTPTGHPSTTWAAPALVALAPTVMLIAFLVHPFIAILPDAEGVAAAVEAGTSRWAVAHLLTNIGSALVAVAFVAIATHLRAAGDDRFSRIGLPLVVFGSVLYGFLPGLEFAPLAAVETGGDVVATQAALEPWFVPMFVTGVVTFAIGVFVLVGAIRVTRILGDGTTRVVVGALVLLAVSRAVPVGVVQFHLQAVVGLVALWPIAGAMWRRSGSTASVRSQPSPAI
jgi:hypothetical protein